MIDLHEYATSREAHAILAEWLRDPPPVVLVPRLLRVAGLRPRVAGNTRFWRRRHVEALARALAAYAEGVRP